jgi:hypothetical protein
MKIGGKLQISPASVEVELVLVDPSDTAGDR